MELKIIFVLIGYFVIGVGSAFLIAWLSEKYDHIFYGSIFYEGKEILYILCIMLFPIMLIWFFTTIGCECLRNKISE
jgi:O-antigen/teichoic acid export membrane protein